MLKAQGVFAGQCVRTIRLERVDEPVETHAHNFPHAAIVGRGTVRFEVLDPAGGQVLVDAELDEGSVFEVRAGVPHRFVAVTVPAIVFCTFPKRMASGEVISSPEEWTGDIRQFQ